jgi:hypothetical protein
MTWSPAAWYDEISSTGNMVMVGAFCKDMFAYSLTVGFNCKVEIYNALADVPLLTFYKFSGLYTS